MQRVAGLPTEPYVYAEWRRCRAGIDYHVEVYEHWSSVPSRLMREAAMIGPSTAALIEQILHAKPHPEQGMSRHPAVGTRAVANMSRQPANAASILARVATVLDPAQHLDRSYRSRSVLDRSAQQHPWRAAIITEEDTLLHHPTADRLRELGPAALTALLLFNAAHSITGQQIVVGGGASL